MTIRKSSSLPKALGAMILVGAASMTLPAQAATTIPASIEAEDFDNGGQGLAYHDNVAGNAGGHYRPDEDVDINRSSSASGGYDVNNFETGEWLNYTVDVPASGNYEISLLVSTSFTDSAYHLEIDNQDVSGRVAVADTGGWKKYAWQAPVTVYLSAGQHVLRIFSDQQYFNFDALRIEAGPGATPYRGTPAPVPGRIEAEAFDNGGQGVAYNDNAAGNAGGQFRPNEDIDIVASADPEGGDFDVNNFETGEWLQYTIDVAEDGQYALELRAATAFTDSAFHVEIDGENVTGRVAVPNTSAWDAYQWLDAQALTLSAGTHTLRIVSDQQYFNLNALRIERASATTPYTGTPIALPGTFEAEDFDLGGEGAAYHDKGAGNAGGQHRPSEDVDIVLTSDSEGGNFDVNNIETGEWLSWTVDVAEAGEYDIALRLASGFDTSAFHVEIDDVNVSGRVNVANTGGWDSYAWITVEDVTLKAGEQRLKVVADEQYFNLNRVRVQPAVAEAPTSTPYGGTSVDMPGVIAAADYDEGGAGLAYQDNVAGNAGGVYRNDDVDLAASSDSGFASYEVNNFETGEWLQYTVNVTAAGTYDVQARVASAFADSALRIEIDGQDVSGRVTVPNTGGWNSYQWVGVEDLQLSAGEHKVRVISEQQYFNMSALRIVEPSAAPPIDPGTVHFFCTFPSSANDCSFGLQSKDPSRAWLTGIARDGGTGILLRTESGDDNVVGSGSAERTDLWISQEATDGYEGREAWWAHSIYFPDDYVTPPWGWGVAFDFHNSAPGPWQANFHVDAGPNGLSFRGYGGVNSGDGYFGAPIGPVQRNMWYDFVYHVRWSSGGDGFFHAWVNGQKVLEHYGPTLYQGQGVYLKLANYHSAFGQGSSVIHDRIVRGSTPQAVSDRPLEGVLELVNGVLTPVNQ